MKAKLRLRNTPADATRLREFVTTFAGQRGLSETDRRHLQIIFDELFANLVTHGYGAARSDGQIDVSLSLERDRLTIEFVDDGRPFNPLAAPPADLELPVAARPVGGIGIPIVRALVDEIGYARFGNRNRLTLVRSIRRPGGNPPK